ncbi:MAG TPA: hypothetical protein VMG10_07080 [Gemmataceae bacterium]|nr:hypothetical protein [Gemmataceae bacterium]
MNLKEFDAKQFLLEKGERIGLGIAVTLMVLMLIFSLFMPSKGFFSGSPADKKDVLEKGTAKLDNDLKSRQIPDNERPEPTKDRKIAFDIVALRPTNYEILGVYQPESKESPARRPPNIYNIEEAVVAVAPVLIDTYLFSSDFSKVYVLREKDRGAAAGNAGGLNPFARAFGGGGPRMAPPGMAPGANPSALLKRQQGRFGSVPGSRNLVGLAANDFEYDVKVIDVKDWNQQELTARQPLPLRVAVIGGSFPYRRQLEEFKKQLRLTSIDAVLNEALPEKEGESFKFLGVEVERVEVDADGKKLGDWNKLPLAETYQLWLKHTFLPFQPENPRYNLVKIDGLVAPLLREFHANKKVDPTMRVPGMMMVPGMPQPSGQPGGEDFEADVKKTNYPDVVAELPKIQDTLRDLGNVQATRVPTSKATEAAPFDPFRPYAAPLADNAGARKDPMPADASPAPDLKIPEYMLMRLVDVNLEPGKSYRYRVRIKMNNPNYKNPNVASPAYKIDKELTSKSWYEIKQVARVPPELKYYVVDEKKEASQQDQRAMHQKRYVSAQARMWERNPKPDQVVFQLQRWVESTPLSRRESDVVPVGQWAVADRVFVNRGEYVGQKVRVDMPIWKYSQNAYVLPAEKPEKSTARSRLLTPTGIDVDFGFDSSSLDTILVDFEGGRILGPSKIDDTCRTEVLMLSPDGKLLARNNAKDTADEERKDRRDKVLQRIEDIRQGKVAE